MTWDRGGSGRFLYILRANGGLVPRVSPTSCCQGSGDAITDPAVVFDVVPGTFRSEPDGTTTVHLPHGEDPRQERLRFSPEGAAALEIAGDANTVRGLTVQNATYGILLSDGRGNVVEHNTVRGGFHSILLDGADVRETEIRHNRITLGFSHTLDPTDPYHWYVWNLFRNFSDSPRVAIAVFASGPGNRLHHNFVHEHFSAIHHTPLRNVLVWPVQDGQPDVGPYGHDLEIDHNKLQDLANDGVLLGGSEVGTRVHHNVIVRANAGVRLFGPTSGPLHVYANHIDLPSGYRTVPSSRYPGGRPYLFGAVFMFAESPAAMYLYRNALTAATCYTMGSSWIGSRLGVPMHTGVPDAWYIRNAERCAATFAHDSAEWQGSDGRRVAEWMGAPLPDFDAPPIGPHDLDDLGVAP